ncbi:hypothetical protein PRIPAC_74646 [Pristionchus pacificus]|uniref:Uncharacterized protein n=1 Tax=Pristionchus pacificus TaxID=54126 RepID=A0A2A6CA27_PRIPA|nr:hypothetical protein PRIPAC_74646 [Pristionchus pacificus]|eukprot:PDM75034.1 hypothetical protein PRIPAC_40415 [Pristionchus pacificus]
MISLLWTILLFPSFLLSTLSTDPPTDAKYVDLIEKDDYYECGISQIRTGLKYCTQFKKCDKVGIVKSAVDTKLMKPKRTFAYCDQAIKNRYFVVYTFIALTITATLSALYYLLYLRWENQKLEKAITRRQSRHDELWLSIERMERSEYDPEEVWNAMPLVHQQVALEAAIFIQKYKGEKFTPQLRQWLIDRNYPAGATEIILHLAGLNDPEFPFYAPEERSAASGFKNEQRLDEFAERIEARIIHDADIPVLPRHSFGTRDDPRDEEKEQRENEMSSLRITASLLVLATVSNGLVQFSQSALYDIYDFQGVKEVPLANCANGCYIFASTTETAQDAYMKNLVVHDYASGKDMSIAAISKQIQVGTSQKLPYDLVAAGRYSILNLNAADAQASDVAVYVVDRTKARSIDFEIYDAATMARATVAPKTVVTVLAAKHFFVKADKGQVNSFTARLTGFENAQENNADNCVYAYKTQTFDGFEFHVSSAIVSFVFDKKNPVTIKANYDWLNVRHLDQAGFLSSPGFHGCAKVNALQVFRQFNGGFYGEEFDLHANNKLRVTWDIDANVTQDIVIKDMTNSKRNAVNGVKKNFQIVMEGTDFVTSYYNSASPPYGFIARHTPTRV